MYFPSDDDEDITDYEEDYEGDDYPFDFGEYGGIFGNFDFYHDFGRDFDNSDEDDDDNNDCVCSRFEEIRELTSSEIRQLTRCKDTLDKLRESRENDQFCDAVIKVEDQEFRVHKLILVTNSTYFEAMFSRPFNEQSEKCVILQGITKSAFAQLLDFLYGGVLHLTETSLQSIYEAADMFCIDALLLECREYLIDNWKDFKDLATVFSLVELFDSHKVRKEIIEDVTFALQYGTLDNTKLLLTSPISSKPYFTEMPFDFLILFLKSDSLQKYEYSTIGVKLVASLVMWMSFKPEERLRHAEELVGYLKMNLIPWDQLMQFRTQMDELFVSVQSEEIDQLEETFKSVFLTQREAFQSQIKVLGLKFSLVWEEDIKEDQKRIVCHQFQSHHDEWEWETNMFEIGFKPETCLVKDNKVYLLGTKKIALYSTDDKTVAHLQDMPNLGKRGAKNEGRSGYAACFYRNEIVIAGGVIHETKTGVNQIWHFNTDSNYWRNGMKWFHPKTDCGMIANEQDVFIVGGYVENGNGNNSANAVLYMGPNASKEVYRYNLPTHKFSKVCKLDNGYLKPRLALREKEMFVMPREMLMLIHNPEVVNIAKKAKVTHYNLENKGRFPRSRVMGVYPVDEDLLMIIEYSVQGIDQAFLMLLKPSKEIVYLGFLPKLPLPLKTIAATNSTGKTWFTVSKVT